MILDKLFFEFLIFQTKLVFWVWNIWSKYMLYFDQVPLIFVIPNMWAAEVG